MPAGRVRQSVFFLFAIPRPFASMHTFAAIILSSIVTFSLDIEMLLHDEQCFLFHCLSSREHIMMRFSKPYPHLFFSLELSLKSPFAGLSLAGLQMDLRITPDDTERSFRLHLFTNRIHVLLNPISLSKYLVRITTPRR